MSPDLEQSLTKTKQDLQGETTLMATGQTNIMESKNSLGTMSTYSTAPTGCRGPQGGGHMIKLSALREVNNAFQLFTMGVCPSLSLRSKHRNPWYVWYWKKRTTTLFSGPQLQHCLVNKPLACEDSALVKMI